MTSRPASPGEADLLDVAIIGAGPVGGTLAALAADTGLSITVFEARSAASSDRRTLALSHASREILEEAGAWPSEVATAIETIHISQKGGLGRTRLEAREQGLPALGYTVPYAALETGLARRLDERGVRVCFGESCTGIDLAPDAARVTFASGREARARLLVLADGGANSTRIPGIAYEGRDYDQVAVTGAVWTDRPHGAWAYERFTPRGPAALLPVEDRYAFVWTESPREGERLLALEENAFLAELQAHFGDRAGRFVRVANRAAFPLRLRTVNSTIALRTAIVGNAAQALHPVAGQGLNLGLRDAATLADLLRTRARGTVGDSAMLSEYRARRRRDSGRGVAFTDFLVSAFADARPATTLGRGLVLTLLDLVPPARRLVARRMIQGPDSR